MVLSRLGSRSHCTAKKERHFMATQLFTRRDFSVRLASLFPTLGIAGAAVLAPSAMTAEDAHIGEISRTAESIHQEPVFKANRKRIYEALMDEKQFSKMT